MDKNNSVGVGHTPCDECGQPSVMEVNGRLFCARHAPGPGEKRASDSSPSFKNAVEQLVDAHLPTGH